MPLTSSVIVCTRNRPKDLQRMLASLQVQSIQPTELIIIDSSTIPMNQQSTFVDYCNENNWLQTRVYYEHTKPGLTLQRNVGLARVFGDIIYFFDDDVVLEPNYLEQMQLIFEQFPTYGGGMGSIINMDSKHININRFFRTFFLLPRDYASGSFTWSGLPTHAYGLSHFKKVEVLGGCCMAYRKIVLGNEQFDEKLHGYGYMEDCDFSRRISYTYSLFYNPAARLYHYNSPISRDAVTANRAMFVHNYSYLFFKNVYPRNKLKIIAYCWSVMGLFLEAIVWRQKTSLYGYARGLQQFYFASKNP